MFTVYIEIFLKFALQVTNSLTSVSKIVLLVTPVLYCTILLTLNL